MDEEFNYFNFYENLYYKEIERKDKHNSRLSLIITVLIFFSGIIAVIFEKAISIDVSSMKYTIYSLLGFVVLLMIICIIITGRTFLWGSDYHYLPDSKKIDDYRMGLKDYYQKSGEPKDNTDLDFKTMILELFIECTTINMGLNYKRSKFFKALMVLLVIITIFLSVTYIFCEFAPKLQSTYKVVF